MGVMREIRTDLAGLEKAPGALRNFGLLFSALFCIGAVILFWQGNPLWAVPATASVGSLLAGMFFSRALVCPYRAWMTLALVIGWSMTRLILTAVYFIAMTPMGWLLKMLGKDVLDQRIEKGSSSYWKRHEATTDREQYRKQY